MNTHTHTHTNGDWIRSTIIKSNSKLHAIYQSNNCETFIIAFPRVFVLLLLLIMMMIIITITKIFKRCSCGNGMWGFIVSVRKIVSASSSVLHITHPFNQYMHLYGECFICWHLSPQLIKTFANVKIIHKSIRIIWSFAHHFAFYLLSACWKASTYYIASELAINWPHRAHTHNSTYQFTQSILIEFRMSSVLYSRLKSNDTFSARRYRQRERRW